MNFTGNSIMIITLRRTTYPKPKKHAKAWQNMTPLSFHWWQTFMTSSPTRESNPVVRWWMRRLPYPQETTVWARKWDLTTEMKSQYSLRAGNSQITVAISFEKARPPAIFTFQYFSNLASNKAGSATARRLSICDIMLYHKGCSICAAICHSPCFVQLCRWPYAIAIFLQFLLRFLSRNGKE